LEQKKSRQEKLRKVLEHLRQNLWDVRVQKRDILPEGLAIEKCTCCFANELHNRLSHKRTKENLD